MKDRLAWLSASNGKYSIKSGYQYWQNQLSDIRQVSSNKSWSRIWKLEVPHKTRIFVWRLCKNIIPMRNLLRGRGVLNPIICPMCERDIEHVMHLFFDCEYASKCWEKAGVKYDVSSVEYAADWLLDKLETETMDNLITITKVLAGIWFARNKRVWEGKNLDPSTMIDLSSKQIVEWQEANKKTNVFSTRMSNGTAKMISWIAPESGWLKLNVDASLYEGDSSFAIGMVLRNDQGQFVMGKNMRVAGQISVLEAETYEVQEALSWVRELQLKKVIIECDSSLVVNALQNNSEYYLEVGNLLAACHDVMRDRSDLVIRHIKKHANRVAHNLAIIPCLIGCYNLFVSPPQCVLEVLLSDCSSF